MGGALPTCCYGVDQMCGICGIAPTDTSLPDQELLESMQAAITHRGPDSAGQHVAAGIGLAARRLSVVDLVTGDQPMRSEDQNVSLVYNGEIYNHRELRSELESKGHRYYSHSDAETVIHSYEEWREASVALPRNVCLCSLGCEV